MDLDVKKIINLHKIDTRLQEIHDEKGGLPEIINEQKEKVDELKNKIQESEEEIKLLNKDKSVCTLSIEDFNSNLDKHNKQMDNVKNNKEYDALLLEIDHLKKENNELQSKVGVINNSIEDMNTSNEEINSKINSLIEKIDDNEKELNEKSVEFSIEEKLLEKDKTKLMSEISNNRFLEQYKEDNESLVTAVYSGSCGTCFFTLPALDLAIVAAIAGSFRDKVIDPLAVLIGEVGLTGEVRSVMQLDARILEAKRLGFKKCIIPYSAKKIKKLPDKGIDFLFVKNLAELFEHLFE